MLTYSDMIASAKKAGAFDEKVMWRSIADVEQLLNGIKEHHPDKYWSFMRRQYGLLHNGHYGEDFALYDISQMYYTDKDNKKHNEPHWSCDEAQSVMPNGLNKWDWWVALSATHSDLCNILSDEDIIKVAFQFWFKDEDWPSKTKIWDYMMAKNNLP